MSRIVRQTLVIARRDFVATVFTPTFLIFLFAPLLMLSFSVIGGASAAKLAEGGMDKRRIVALAGDGDARLLQTTDARLRGVFRTAEAPPKLELRAPAADVEAQARQLFADKQIEVAAVMFGPLARPTVFHAAQGERTAAYLAAVAEQGLRDRAGGIAHALSTPTIEPVARTGSTDSGRQASGFAAVFGIFFLTLLLAGQAVGMLAEEKSNKVIEILAAAVPLEAVFMGKLIGMFGVALLFIGFWATLLSQAASLTPPDMMALTELQPALGLGIFAVLFGLYFAMSYLLLGAVFLGVGAQASTMREIQMMSLPISIFQVAMFGVAAAAAGAPGSPIATFAAIFPFSSPLAMAARAATDGALWPHALALAWQILWVGITVWVAARWFRKGVLKSGGKSGWKALFSKG